MLLTALRAAGPSDLKTVAAFWLAMFEEIGMHRRGDFTPEWEERFVSYFTERIALGQAQFGLATDDGRIVGTAGALVNDGYPASIHGIRSGYIFGVRVEPEFRGRGIARTLTNDAVQFLRGSGCRRIRLHASPAGRPIYEALGFIPTNEMQLPSDV